MVDKCALCEEKLEMGFLDKLDGTVVKIKKEDKNEFFKVCSSCQKKFKDKLKQEVEKKVK